MSDRIWKETIPPKMMHDMVGVYKGIWFPQMDRCWTSDDGYQVTSRLIRTEWGKVEHASIIWMKPGDDRNSVNGERDIPWKIKQEIKNELFGKKRVAIEVFPTEKNCVDIMDVYHLWILPEGFVIPFGIHPTRDVQCSPINRGYPKNPTYLVENTKALEESGVLGR